jgi:hypothetical protein
VFDMSGNCRAYVNADGMTVTDTMTYRAFGEEIAGNAPNAKQSHYGAQFGYYHNTAGTSGVGAGRLYVRERWMDPTKSVWLSRDPLWEQILRSGPVGWEAMQGIALKFAQKLADVSGLVGLSYMYANNMPVTNNDPTGLGNSNACQTELNGCIAAANAVASGMRKNDIRGRNMLVAWCASPGTAGLTKATCIATANNRLAQQLNDINNIILPWLIQACYDADTRCLVAASPPSSSSTSICQGSNYPPASNP